MKLLFRYFPVLLLFTTAGCLEIDTVIRLEEDGSGTIEETVLMSSEMVNMLKQLTASIPPDSGTEAEEFKLFDESALREEAASFGKDVVYSEGKELKEEGREGYTALFRFKNIADIQLNQNPNRQMALEAEEEDKEKISEEYIRFDFTKGDPAKVIVHLSPHDLDTSDIESDEIPDSIAASPEDADKLKEFMKGLKISLSMEFDKDIKNSNASYHEGKRVTLFDIDFDKLIENPERFKEFSEKNPETLHELKQIIKDMPGVKVELNEDVFVEF